MEDFYSLDCLNLVNLGLMVIVSLAAITIVIVGIKVGVIVMVMTWAVNQISQVNYLIMVFRVKAN